MKKIALFAISFFLSVQVCAIDLVGVYKDALLHDPAYQEVRAQFLSDRENIAISRSGLLPQLNFGASFTKIYDDVDSAPLSKKDIQQYAITLKQPLFNVKSWKEVASAKASVRSSLASYFAAYQNLLVRVATAYFAVLESQDLLHLIMAKKKAIALQLKHTKERFKEGLVTIIDVHQAEANYDSTFAEQIEALNNLANKKEVLREITGKTYRSFARLHRLPLLSPQPNDVDEWAAVALKQNYRLLAAYHSMNAARENIRVQTAGNFPTINLQGSGSYLKSTEPSITTAGSFGSRSRSAGVGIALDFPIIQGGLVGAKARQATYQYEKASAILTKTQRQVVSKTRQDYLGVISSINKVDAGRKIVKSASTSLRSTKAGYDIGAQMMVDVLNMRTELYKARMQLARDQYSYILKTLELKFDTGALDSSDIISINNWLIKTGSAKKISKKTKHMVAKKDLTSIKGQLLAKNPNHYTLQLMASRKRDGLINYMNVHKITGRAYIYCVKRDGKIWFKLMQGDYATRKEAREGRAIFIKKYNVEPWIRRYQSIHQELS